MTLPQPLFVFLTTNYGINNCKVVKHKDTEIIILPFSSYNGVAIEWQLLYGLYNTQKYIHDFLPNYNFIDDITVYKVYRTLLCSILKQTHCLYIF